MRTPNLARKTYSLMIWTPIVPGQEDALRSYLEGLDKRAGPLTKVPRTHMARWIIVPDMPVAPGTQLRDPMGTEFLLFTSNFDGDADSYLYELVAQMPEEAAAIWGHCVGCPRPAEGAALKAYIHRNQVDSGFAFAAYGDASAAQIKSALDKRTRLIDFAIRAQGMKSSQRRKAFLKEFGSA